MMECSKQTCKREAAAFLVNNRALKVCALHDLESASPLYGSLLYCKEHANEFRAPVGWELSREVRVFASFEIDREKQELAKREAQERSNARGASARISGHPVLRGMRGVRSTPPSASQPPPRPARGNYGDSSERSAQSAPDDDLTRLMSAVRRPSRLRGIQIPENMQGARRGNLVAVRLGE